MADSGAALKAAHDLMHRLPPSNVEKNLSGLIHLYPALQEDLLSTVDQPLQVEKDSSGREFLLCDYNRDGDSFRCARHRVPGRPGARRAYRA